MATNGAFRLYSNLADQELSIDVEYRLVHGEGLPCDNLYFAPKSSVGAIADTPAGVDGNGIWILEGGSSPRARQLSASKGAQAFDFLRKASSENERGFVIFQIPTKNGFVAHADPWTFRIADCFLVSSVQSFISPLSEVKACTIPVTGIEGVAAALEHSVGAVASHLPLVDESVQELELELKRRLNFPWLSSEPVPSRRVCIVVQNQVSIAATKSRFDTAAALGIKVVVMSIGSWWREGHEPYTHLREGTIDVDLAPDSGRSQRIADAVRSYPHPIDGICAWSDGLLIDVAAAAAELGLWSSGPKPYSVSTNKYLTRQLIDPESAEYFAVTSMEDLEARLRSDTPIVFPVVCKPFSGRASEGVYKADDAAQLRHAVGQTFASKNGNNVLIEPYIDGPEVDCHIVLLDGEVLHAEILDDFPSDADLAEDVTDKLFSETQEAVPTQLPRDEQHALVETIADIVRRQGFQTGVFNTEARVRNSAMKYVLGKGHTIPDLEVTGESRKEGEPIQVVLHEVNARTPGIASSASSRIAIGIDYFALQILAAVSDWTRYKALSIPFVQNDRCDHVWLTNSMTPVTYAGIKPLMADYPVETWDHQMVDSRDSPIIGLSKTHGHLTKYVLRHNANIKEGERYGYKAGDWVWAGCMVIASPVGRRHAHQVAESLQAVYNEYVRRKYYV
ncbi:putative carnosine synthase 1 [Xylariaceae sp. FL0594]|nr:putative carnosine synthase 1 [Xylariaceae sp. FL0594]